MKPVSFDYERPADIDAALALLDRSDAFVKILAGGQSLGPMLNLRLVQPDLLVDVSRLPELKEIRAEVEGIFIGASVTTASLEDTAGTKALEGALAGVAAGIAYRAVRNRGTIGGSLAHADPAADWLSALAAFDSDAVIAGRSGRRRVPVADFAIGAFETVLQPDELLEGISIPRPSDAARWSYYKFCRKTGEFAEAIGAILSDPERGICRAVIGATDSRPIVLADAVGLFPGDAGRPLHERLDERALDGIFDDAGLSDDPYTRQVHRVALKRAAQQIG